MYENSGAAEFDERNILEVSLSHFYSLSLSFSRKKFLPLLSLLILDVQVINDRIGRETKNSFSFFSFSLPYQSYSFLLHDTNTFICSIQSLNQPSSLILFFFYSPSFPLSVSLRQVSGLILNRAQEWKEGNKLWRITNMYLFRRVCNNSCIWNPLSQSSLSIPPPFPPSSFLRNETFC